MIQMTAKNATTVQPTFSAAPKKLTPAEARKAIGAARKADRAAHDPKVTMGDKKTLPIEGGDAGAKKTTTKASEKNVAKAVEVAKTIERTTKKLTAAQEAVIAKKKEEAKVNAANKAKTVFTFKSLPANGEKIAPQLRVVLATLKTLKKATMTELCAALTKSGELKTVQTPERIVTFYRKQMEAAGYVVIS